MVGTAARIRLSLVISLPPGASGTLKSTRMNTRLPFKSRSRIETVPIAGGWPPVADRFACPQRSKCQNFLVLIAADPRTRRANRSIPIIAVPPARPERLTLRSGLSPIDHEVENRHGQARQSQRSDFPRHEGDGEPMRERMEKEKRRP